MILLSCFQPMLTRSITGKTDSKYSYHNTMQRLQMQQVESLFYLLRRIGMEETPL